MAEATENRDGTEPGAAAGAPTSARALRVDGEATLRGVVPVVPTPFDEDSLLDLRGLREVVDRLVDAGVDGLTALGSGGEVGYLSSEERLRVVDTVTRRAGERAFVLAGIALFGTAQAVEEARRLEGAGASALLVALPQYFRTPLSSVLRHYEAVCKAVDLPVLYYHFPFVFGLALTPKEIGELFARVPLAGTKESGLSTPELREHIARIDRPVSVFTGQSFNVPEAVGYGAVGTICPMPTLLPKSALAAVAGARKRDGVAAESARRRLLDALPIVAGGKLPARVAEIGLRVALKTGARIPQSPGHAHAGIKEALRVLGIIECAKTRAPQAPIDAAHSRVVAKLARRVAEV